MVTGVRSVIGALWRKPEEDFRVVVAVRLILGGMLTTGLLAGVIVAPAIGATEDNARVARKPTAAARALTGFTPAAADPRLAAVFARGGLDAGDFRFTPSESRTSTKAVTVAVRARSNRSVDDAERLAAIPAPTVGLAPIAYNLGVAVGWKRFALSGDLAKVDLAGAPGGRDAADVAISYAGNRFAGQVRASTDKPAANGPQLVESPPSYALDVGGSYSLSRHIDLTAGVRYKSERDRLARFNDDRRDSQAVYVGTAFRF